MTCLTCADEKPTSLKVDLLGQWIETAWQPRFPDQNLVTLWTSAACVNGRVLAKFSHKMTLAKTHKFVGYEEIPCEAVVHVKNHDEMGNPTAQGGAFLFHFEQAKTKTPVDILVLSAFSSDEGFVFQMVCIAAVPAELLPVWAAFSSECDRLHSALEPTSKVVIIGGRSASFVPTVDWDDIVLPAALKHDILNDVESFFTKGIDIYKRLKLKPFRKLLMAGVPGTGKTMLCSALANWAIARKYLVIYVSSADREGAKFWKIEHALDVASNSKLPTLILLEEIDAYLHEEEKALVLNVLDGAESSINDRGSLLIATTNYPEAIDERILKRPGRLDRIFIIPEAQNIDNAEKLLRQYLGEMWRDEHSVIATELVGYPGAFIREVAIHALTQVAYEDLHELPFDILEHSFNRLREQIDSRDDFFHKRNGIGLVTR